MKGPIADGPATRLQTRRMRCEGCDRGFSPVADEGLCGNCIRELMEQAERELINEMDAYWEQWETEHQP